MLQQRIPSIIIKLFRSFMDISASYYKKEHETEMASIEETGDIITDILKQFVRNKSVLYRLITEDSFFMIMRIMTARPAGQQDINNNDHAYMLWKKNITEVLKVVDMNSEICQYIHQRRCCIDLLIRMWRENTAKGYLTNVDQQEIIMGLDIIYYQLRESAKIQFFGLFDEMIQASGYEALCDILRTGPFNEATIHAKMEIVNKIVELSFVGKISPIPSISDGLPYQHEDFTTPQPTGCTEKIVKNINAFQCLQLSFLYPFNASNIPNRHEFPTSLHIKLFNAIKETIEAHACNYFVIDCTNVLPQLIESMEKYDLEIQQSIMQLLSYIMVDLNFVPLKELAVLSLHLQSSSSGKLIGLICGYLEQLLKKSAKFFVVVQESGLINIMSLMLSDVTEKIQYKSEDDQFLNHALSNFDQIINCIITMLSIPMNAVIYKKTYRGNLFDLLQYPETRLGTLRLFESLSSQNYDLTLSSSISSNSSSNIDSSTSVEVGNAFSKVMEALQSVPRNDLEFRLEVLNTIKRIFKANGSTRDIFRRIGGYVSLVSMIVSLEGAFEEPERYINDHMNDVETVCNLITAVIQTIFLVLAESMHDHQVNKKYFLKDVGYSSLENAVMLTGALNDNHTARNIFGIFFGFALDDETVYELFLSPIEETSNEYKNEKAITIDILRSIDLVLKVPSAKVVNPEIMPSIVNLQKIISTIDAQLSHAILYAINALTQANRGNQVKLNSSGLVLVLLTRIFPSSSPGNGIPTNNPEERNTLLRILKNLLCMGINFEELRYMFRKFNMQNGRFDLSNSFGLLDLILEGASQNQWPNFIQFDMGANKHASLEIPELPNFPPNSPGYTLLSWVFIEQQDDISNLSLFSLYDLSNLVFKIYIDAETKQLRVYNVASKNDAIFKKIQFNTGAWYHIAIIHHRPRISVKFSSMDLYVNGEHIEQLSCSYITHPSQPSNVLKAVIGSLKDEHLTTSSQLIWNLGPMYLLQETLEKETISWFFSLGPRYKSLFQDSLRQFQTYEASASLLLTLKETTKPALSRRNSVQTQHLLASIIKNTHFQRVSENKILIALFACNVLADGARTGLTLTGLNEAAEMTIKTELDYSRLVLNAGISKLDLSIYSPKNMAYLVGEPIVAYPFGLDESLWKIGGCAVALKLIEQSESSETLYKSMTFLFSIIRYSWRNSEDMERHHGYEILAHLLKKKRELITEGILELLLVFIGKDPHSPENSIINNPLAYRYVVLNFEIWKKTPISVQKAQLDQFVLFLSTSKMSYFNSRRLPKIHLVKKVLLAFKMNVYSKELIPHLVTSLKVIMLSDWNTDSIRAVATFLASTLPKGNSLVTVANAFCSNFFIFFS
ncbi:MAG: hypothetical protein EXX96DRAFT_375724 [Benjaminiella poitrasii]|nr:MAG: hypothetical protein EXX96DRAFT_375724 [Benjaminiella poitrasii]